MFFLDYWLNIDRHYNIDQRINCFHHRLSFRRYVLSRMRFIIDSRTLTKKSKPEIASSLLIFGFNCGILCIAATGFKPWLYLRIVVLVIFIFLLFAFRLEDQFIMLLTLFLNLFTLLVVPTSVLIRLDLSTNLIFRVSSFIVGSFFLILIEKLEIIDAQEIMQTKTE